jgi:Tfp pilus assembly ATPase PilU
MNTTTERIVNLFEMTDRNEIAKEIDIILDDMISSIGVRLEREFTFKDSEGAHIASTCYVSPPRVDDYITVKDKMYKILKIVHCYETNASGTIIVELV